jgi:hypothetical protein
MDSRPDRDGDDWLIEAAQEMGHESEDKFWLRHGFATFGEYIEHIERSWDKVSWAQEGPGNVPAVSTPAFSTESSDRVESELGSQRRNRQVGMRLTPGDFELLAEAAKLHGVAPSTLARILTVAGAKALVSRTRSA